MSYTHFFCDLWCSCDSSLGSLIRKIANLPDDLQVEVFRSIASFPAITLPVLEMTGNEFARVFESSRAVPLGEPCPLPEQAGGWGVTTRAKGKKQLLETDSDGDEDEHDEEEMSEDERTTLKRRKVKTIALHPLQSICISQHSPILVWVYSCSYICNCLKMPKKSQINEYSHFSVREDFWA